MQGLRIALKASMFRHELVEFAFADVAEWWVPEVMSEADGFGQVRVDIKFIVQVRATA